MPKDNFIELTDPDDFEGCETSLRLLDLVSIVHAHFEHAAVDDFEHASVDELTDIEFTAIALGAFDGTLKAVGDIPSNYNKSQLRLQFVFEQLLGSGRVSTLNSYKSFDLVYAAVNDTLAQQIWKLTSDEVLVFLDRNEDDDRSFVSNLGSSASGLGDSASDLNANRSPEGYLISEQLDLPVVDDLDELSEVVLAELVEIAKIPQDKAKLDRSELEKTILQICKGRYITLQSLAKLVDRRPQSLRNEYLTPMVRARTLTLAYPKNPTHERQAYCALLSLNLEQLAKTTDHLEIT